MKDTKKYKCVKNHKAQLTITRPTYGDGRKKIKISVRDIDARFEFLELEIDLASFTECLTGLSHVNCDMKVKGLENVGKKRESKTIEFEMSENNHRSKEEAIRLSKEVTPDGWICSGYFGSKDSFFRINGKPYARTTISRWVDKGE